MLREEIDALTEIATSFEKAKTDNAVLRAQLAVTEKALELAVDSDASNFCVFNGIEKGLWPDYCKNPPETEHKTCVMCWRSYYLAKAGSAHD